MRAGLSAVLLPDVVAGFIPLWILSSPVRWPIPPDGLRWAGVAPLAAGLATRHLHLWVGNPMYLGVLGILVGLGLLGLSGGILAYAAVAAVAFHLRVIGWEEPTLQRLFDRHYAAYCRQVPRWRPRRPR